jgi:hypothetical protein
MLIILKQQLLPPHFLTTRGITLSSAYSSIFGAIALGNRSSGFDRKGDLSVVPLETHATNSGITFVFLGSVTDIHEAYMKHTVWMDG